MKFDNRSSSSELSPVSSEESIASILLSLQQQDSHTSNSKTVLFNPTISTLLQPPVHLCQFNPCTFCSESAAPKRKTALEEGAYIRYIATRQTKKVRDNVAEKEKEDEGTPRYQAPRSENDLYSPRWVRYHGHRKEGLCGLCPEKWLQLKDSAFWFVSLAVILV